MSKTIDAYFDVGSPAAYLAWTQLPALAERNDATINWRPMLLGGVFKATGNASPITIPSKGRYTLIDYTRHAKAYGVPFTLNPNFPINTLQLMRAAAGYVDSERFDDYSKAIFIALWVDKKNMNDLNVVGEVLSESGFDPQEVLALCNDQNSKDKLREITDEAVSRGVFGAPTFFVGKEIFFGQDRLTWVEKALQGEL